jgi:hypothetical protein
MREKVGFALVSLMVGLQAFYGFYAYMDPVAFSALRGTNLFSPADSDWVQIYASRTLFIAFIVGLLLYLRSFKLIAQVALFGTIMPITDGWLAFQAEAPLRVVIKHAVTAFYLMLTTFVLLPYLRQKNL